jgi:hypothetical protein
MTCVYLTCELQYDMHHLISLQDTVCTHLICFIGSNVYLKIISVVVCADVSDIDV